MRNDLSTRVLSDTLTYEMASIRDFLSKPQRVATLSWTTAQLQNAVLGGYRVGPTLLANTYWMNKIQGFGLVRGDATLRVQLTANPFQQGKLLIHFLPCEGDFSAYDVSYEPMHDSCIAAKRQQPCVELDCRDSVAEMTMPYITPTNWFNVKTGTYDWGTFVITILGPLAVGATGETTVDVTVYLSFDNFEVAAPLVPQSKGSEPKKKFKAKSFSMDQAAMELKAMQKGTPISSALKIGANVAGALGKVPILSAVAQPAEWLLDAAAGVAGFFGWSKPMNNTPATHVSQQYGRYLASSDGISNAIPIGLRSDNKISVTDHLSIYDKDEMSFEFLKRVETITDTLNWTTSQVSGTSLLSRTVRPDELYQAGTTTAAGHTASWRCGPPIFYFAKAFKLWRGGIRVKIKLVKTDFHSGRLQVTWTPGNTVTTTPTLSSSLLSMREIIDVRSGSEFEFVLPYMLETNYAVNTESMGQLDIQVLNELRAPETCSGTVNLLVYFSGADDFEMQNPGYDGVSSTYNLPFSPQSGDILVAETIGGVSDAIVTTDYAEASIGEMFTSVKQLYSRNSQIYMRAAPGAPAASGIFCWPWLASVPYVNAGTGALQSATFGGDIYSLVSPMYAFYRGGVNITVQTTTSDTSGTGRNALTNATLMPVDPIANPQGVLQASLSTDGDPGPTDYLTVRQSGLQGVAINQAGLGLVTVRVPYLAKTKCSLLMRQTNSGNIPADRSQPMAAVNMRGIQAFANFAILRSFGDEFQTSYFIGCPPRVISYV